MLIARPRAGYSSNHNRSDCSDFSHRLPPFNRFETKLQIELKTFIVALPSGDGNSRAEFDWNLAGGERERENLQGSATLAARTAVSNFPDVSGLSRLLCATSSLLRWLHSISLFGQDQCFKRNFRLVAAFRFEHWFQSSTSRGFLGIRSIYTSSCIVLGLICLICLKFGWKKLFIIVQTGGYLQIV